MKPTRQLQYAGRDGLIALHAEKPGSAPPAVAEARTHARVISVRPAHGAVLVAIEDAGQVRLIRAATSDAPELAVLSASDRARVAAAVASLHRAGVPGDGGHHAA